MFRFAAALLSVAALLVWPHLVSAQAFEAVGARALGMGGAFVAVADDASATYWNPAGLAAGPLVSLVVESGGSGFSDQPVRTGPTVPPGSSAWLRDRGTLVAFGFPALGVSFYRLSNVSARVITAGPVPPPIGTGAELAALRTSHVGATVLQTIVDGLHVGATLKYVRGSAGARDDAPAPVDPLDEAASLPDQGGHAFDVDAGVMADLRTLRIGLTARNLLEPQFDSLRGGRLELPRQVRAGVAVLPSDRLTLSLDADLTASPDPSGDRRSLAAGVEQRLWDRRLGLRAGVRMSTHGATRPTVTAGASVAVRSAIFADGYVAVGVDGPAPGGAGLGVRVVF